MSPFHQLRKLIQAIVYDIAVLFFQSIIHTFFKDIRVRGSFNAPKSGAVIYVIAPHHNQFLDGCVVLPTIKQVGKRNPSFLIAGKSYRQPFIGLMSRLTSSIPVERAQDMMKPAKGKIYLGDNDNEIIGEGTAFTTTCEAKGLIGLPSSKGNFQVLEVIDDNKLIIKGDYKDKSESVTKTRYDMLKNGSDYKVARHIDNHQLFQNVFDFLKEGKVMGLFPEGGSHDRTDLLPLKPGVAIMALGAISQCTDPGQVINIVPLGLNYFHPHRFRSRAVVEFGKPIEITIEDGKEYLKDNRAAVNKLLNAITLRLKEVTVTCNDYDTLMALQAARRLFTTGQREQTPLPLVVEMNRRLIKGYEMNKDNPDVIEMKQLVTDYNKKLMMLGLHDHQVNSLTKSDKLSIFMKFCNRLFKVFFFFGLSLPGVFLFSPVFITAIRISRKKQQEALAGSVVKIKARDVLGTWKVLVALVLAPALYIFYSVCGTEFIIRAWIPDASWKLHGLVFIMCYAWSVLTTYASLRVGEIGVDYYKSLKPLFYSLVSEHKDLAQIDELKATRNYLADKVSQFCDKYGPSIFDDYQEFYQKYFDGDVSIEHAQIFSDQKSDGEGESGESSGNTSENELQDDVEVVPSVNEKISSRMRQRAKAL